MSAFEDDKGEGRITLNRKMWDIFEGGGEGGWGKGRGEEVWCGVYFGLRKEVWVGTSKGWVWRKGERLEKRKVGGEGGEGGVRTMTVVGSQVILVFYYFYLFFVFFLDSSSTPIFLIFGFVFVFDSFYHRYGVGQSLEISTASMP